MNLPPNFKILLKKEDIEEKIKLIANEINYDYQGKIPILICVLKGAFIFMSNLIHHLTIDIEVDFIELSSYGNITKSSGKIKILKWLSLNIKDKDIIIIEDIIDTGITIHYLIKSLKKENPSSIKICSLTSKQSRRIKEIKIDYLGFEITNRFIVGYGLDYQEKYRNLSEIYYIK